MYVECLQEVGNEEFFKNLAVLELIQTIRSDHTLFTKYQHSSKLVKVINSFALTERDLPSGWEKRVDPNTKRVSTLENFKPANFNNLLLILSSL